MFNNDTWDDDTVIAGFCRDSTSVIRQFQTQSGSESISDTDDHCVIDADSPYKSDCGDLTDLKM